ncbi:DsbE family thiol:disulfide interchange protein [Marinomonas sp.]
MARVLRFIPLLIFIGLGSVFYVQLDKNSQYVPSALIGKTVPEFTLVDLYSNELIRNADLPKTSYIINFWGTWCPACHIEHPFLVALAKQGVTIIGIDYKDEAVAAREWLEEKQNPYQRVLMDELGDFGLDLGVTGAPESFIVNAHGVITYRHQGVINASNWQEIKRYLNE